MLDNEEYERLVKLAMRIVRGLMEKPKMYAKCKCGHSVYDHLDDMGCDAKGCTCSIGFTDAAGNVFTEAEKKIDDLYREINLLKATNHRLQVTNHRLRTEKDNNYDAALEWAANWIIGPQLSHHGVEVQRYANTMAMSIRAEKRFPTNRCAAA